MRDKFIGYYTWTDEEFTELWDNAIFVFDTNTLLNIYRYGQKTCDAFLDTLSLVQENAWLPYVVAEEFHKNRRGCIAEQEQAYDNLTGSLKKSISDFESALGKFSSLKLLKPDDLKSQFQEAVDQICERIEKTREKHPDYSTTDPVLDRITSIFNDRVADPMDEAVLESIYEEGEKRFEEKTPPGFGDKKKPFPIRYNDLVLWKAMIEKAKEEKRPIIFITSDNKEDWWLKHQGKRVGPLPELTCPIRLYHPQC